MNSVAETSEFDAISRLIAAIKPWSRHLVLVGGWAHRLHRFHETAGLVEYRPLLTRDTDLAFSAAAPMVGDISAALKTAGFTERLAIGHEPPVTRYSLGGDDEGFYAEFLTPLHGSGMKRNGQPDATMAKAGITAQRLRHLELLLVEPWPIHLCRNLGFTLDEDTTLQVVNPTSFTVQKLLIHEERPRAKRPQDILYIHDTIELFGESLPLLNEIWRNTVRHLLSEKSRKKVVQFSLEYFKQVSEPLRDAARIPTDRRLDPERVRQVCEAGLSTLLA